MDYLAFSESIFVTQTRVEEGIVSLVSTSIFVRVFRVGPVHCVACEELLVTIIQYLPQFFRPLFRLKHIPRPNLKVCVLGDAQHMDEAKANDIPAMDVEALKKLNKDKKLVKKLGEYVQQTSYHYV